MKNFFHFPTQRSVEILWRQTRRIGYQARPSLQDINDACRLLGVSLETPLLEVKKRYKALIKEVHPDKAGGCKDKTSKIIHAFETVVAAKKFAPAYYTNKTTAAYEEYRAEREYQNENAYARAYQHHHRSTGAQNASQASERERRYQEYKDSPAGRRMVWLAATVVGGFVAFEFVYIISRQLADSAARQASPHGGVEMASMPVITGTGRHAMRQAMSTAPSSAMGSPFLPFPSRLPAHPLLSMHCPGGQVPSQAVKAPLPGPTPPPRTRAQLQQDFSYRSEETKEQAALFWNRFGDENRQHTERVRERYAVQEKAKDKEKKDKEKLKSGVLPASSSVPSPSAPVTHLSPLPPPLGPNVNSTTVSRPHSPATNLPIGSFPTPASSTSPPSTSLTSSVTTDISQRGPGLSPPSSVPTGSWNMVHG